MNFLKRIFGSGNIREKKGSLIKIQFSGNGNQTELEKQYLESHLASPLNSKMKEFGVDFLAGEIMENAIPAFHPTNIKKDIYRKTGNNRAGGYPDLPVGMDWPGGTFLAQINLETLRPGHPYLPAVGMLYFFLISESSHSDVLHEVVYVSDSKNLQKFKPKNTEGRKFKGITMDFEAQAGVPTAFLAKNFPAEMENPFEFSPDQSIGILGPHFDYFGVDSSVEAWLRKNDWQDISNVLYKDEAGFNDLMEKSNQGYREILQQKRKRLDLFNQRRDKYFEEMKFWRRLLVLPSSNETGMVWGDWGSLEIMIDLRDLAKGDFSHTFARIESA